MCDEDWTDINTREATLNKQNVDGNMKITGDQFKNYEAQKFWILVNKAEAFFDLGNIAEANNAFEQAKQHNPQNGC